MRSNNESVRQFIDQMNRSSIRQDAREAISRKIKEQAERLADDMRKVAPVKTGRLRNSIRVEQGKGGIHAGDAPLQFIIRAGGRLTTVEARAGSGAPYDYSLAVEFGTSKETAQPFFFNTAHSEETRIMREIEKTINNEFTRNRSLF